MTPLRYEISSGRRWRRAIGLSSRQSRCHTTIAHFQRIAGGGGAALRASVTLVRNLYEKNAEGI